MNASLKFWTICQISLGKERLGYEYRLLPPAQEFFQRQFPTVLDAQRRNIQIALLTQFQPQKSDI
ncbi:MAG: hypothetical protein WCA35_25170, partial [Kovacikia sp.]